MERPEDAILDVDEDIDMEGSTSLSSDSTFLFSDLANVFDFDIADDPQLGSNFVNVGDNILRRRSARLHQLNDHGSSCFTAIFPLQLTCHPST